MIKRIAFLSILTIIALAAVACGAEATGTPSYKATQRPQATATPTATARPGATPTSTSTSSSAGVISNIQGYRLENLTVAPGTTVT